MQLNVQHVFRKSKMIFAALAVLLLITVSSSMISFSEGEPSGGATEYMVSFNPNGGYLDTDNQIGRAHV